MKAIFIGLLASFFFASSFVLNKSMSDGGGSWLWSASLRYLWMLPLLLLIVLARRKLHGVMSELRAHPWQWMTWSLVGFGLFYAPLCFAAAYSPAWLVAGTWQITIIAGSLLAPLFSVTRLTPSGSVAVRQRIPFVRMRMSVVILVGIGLMEWSQSTRVSAQEWVLGVVPILIAAFAYPLGNRKMMALCGGKLDATQRTLGMTIASLPLWLFLAVLQGAWHGPPHAGQVVQTIIVAVFSGVIATILFFTATDRVKGDVHHLATVEATQSGEVVFTLLGELWLLPGTSISVLGLSGMALVVLGMVLHSLVSSRSDVVAEKA